MSVPPGLTPKDLGTYDVQSRTNPEDTYNVDPHNLTCTCDRYLHSKGTRLDTCRHLELVLRFILREPANNL